MRLITLLYFATACDFVCAQTSLPPEKPVVLVTEIGEIPTTTGRLRVDVRALLSTNQIAAGIEIKDLDRGTSFSVNPEDTSAMMNLLEEALIEASRGKPFAKSAGKFTVTVRETGQKPWLLLKLDDAATAAPPYLIDAGATTQVVRLLAQAKQVSDWFIEKLKVIQPRPIAR